MSETADRVWVVRTEGYALEGDCSYEGDLPEPGEVIEVMSADGNWLTVRVTSVDPDGGDHQITAAQVDAA